MKRIISILILLFSAQLLQAQATYTVDSTILTSRTVADSLDIPWEIIWGPDDYIWCTERYGRVSRINPATGQKNVLLDISSDVYQQSESGMLGMALHPDFTNTPHVFIAYTYLAGSNIKERLVRFNYNGTSLIAADTLLENITGNTTHIGCRLIILPDNTMLMSTGDAQNQTLPQNGSSLSGKILRLNLDGTIPPNNPSPSSYVYSKGHRNAQGLWLAPNGKLYSSEHGPTSDDELNILVSSQNFGWPDVSGYCDSPPETAFCNANNVVEPIAAWTPTIAPSDIIWYAHPAIPEFKDKLLMTVLKDKSLIVFEFNATGDSVISEKKYFKNDFGRLRDICISPSGKIYLATNGSSWTNNNPFTHSIIELSNNAFWPNSTNELSSKENNISVGPNPLIAGQELSINIPQGVKGEFALYDTAGRVLQKQYILNSYKVILNIKAGVYIWKIRLDSGAHNEGKLLIE